MQRNHAIKRMLACATVALFALAPSAKADVFHFAPATLADAANAKIVAADTDDRGSLFMDASGTDETDNTVTIAPGGTVEFAYPSTANSHNVVFGDPNTGEGPQPASCTQTGGLVLGAVPPLPAFPFNSWDGTCTFNTPGTYTFFCGAHKYMVGTVVVQTQANQNPTVTGGRTPTGDVTTGTAINFTANGSDPDNDPLTYSWDFGDTGTSTSQNPTHSYATAGTYAAKVTVSDGKGGSATDTVNVTVTAPVNHDPTVTAGRTPTGSVAANTAIAFTAAAADTDGDTLTYAWDFGDTATSAAQNPSHSYAAAGTYTAKVTVTDGKGGSATDQLSITVTAATCPTTFRDDFNGTSLDPTWSVVRPSGTLTVGGGVVSIPTESGDIYQTTNTATNIVLRPGPTSGAWTMTAKINHHGLTRYQQGGIILYGDDDNYIKLDRTATNNGGTATEFMEFIQETAATARNTSSDHTANLNQTTFPADFYLRMVSDGTNVTGSYSTDQTTWTNVGRVSAGMPANAQVGIFALSNGATTTVTPTFDWFQEDGANITPGCSGPVNANPVISTQTASVTNGIASLPVNFTATATDADNDPLTYTWDFGDGTPTSTTQNPTHTYTAAGTYNAKVTVDDGKGGTASKTVVITVLAPNNPAARFRVLIFSKTAAFRHDSIPQGIAAIQTLGTQNDWQVDATEDATFFRDDILSHYQAVIFLSTTGDVLTDDQQAAFQRYIEAGGGYVGIHSATDTEYGWAWYGQMTGAYFRDHPNGTPTATVHIDDATDPSTAGLPANWVRTDEWYNFQGPVNPVVSGGGNDYDPRNSTGIHVLLTVDESTYVEGDGSDGVDDDHPISWCHRYDGGRAWYTAMGHTQASYSEAGFLSHIAAGISEAAGYLPSAACGVVKTNANPTVTSGRTPTGTIATGTSVAFTSTGSDPDGDPLTYTWDFGDATPGSTVQNPTHTYATAGSFTATVTVSDGKGGTASAPLTIVVTQPNRAPTVTVARTPAGDVTTADSVAFTATGADADNDPLTYSWDFGDGTPASSQQNPSHTYTTAGTYAAKVTVSDGRGGTVTSNPLTVIVTQPNRAPTVTASRTPTGSVAAGTAIAFTAVGADADNDTLSYSWDFGDGTPASTQQNPSHTYTAGGTYAAKVTVSDGKGGTVTSDPLSVVVTGGGPPQSTSTTGGITATVGSVLAITLSNTATFGAITPGVGKDYTASIAALVTSTAGDAKLTVADPSANAPGHLVNGQYSLAAPLQAQATNAAHPTSAFAVVTGADSPLTLLTWNAATSADAVTIGLKQTIGATEVLRSGGYTKTLTFTVSTTTP